MFIYLFTNSQESQSQDLTITLSQDIFSIFIDKNFPAVCANNNVYQLRIKVTISGWTVK